MVVAEKEDVLEKIGWPSIGADMGAPGQNMVAISRYTGGNFSASVSGDAREHMLALSRQRCDAADIMAVHVRGCPRPGEPA